MEKVIFTISGLRGIFGKTLTPELVMDFSRSFGSYLKGKKVAISRDTRFSGPILFHAVATGLLGSGSCVYDFGVCPTPAIVMMTKKLGYDGGIQITASHNPEVWNGLKFISGKGRFLYPNELKEFKKHIHKENKKRIINVKPNIFKKEIITPYIKNIVSSIYFNKINNTER